MMNKTLEIVKLILLMILIFIGMGCEQSDPPDYGRDGDRVTFSGRSWTVKTGSGLMGPGPNWFSNSYSDVFIDEKGRLHMKIAEHDGKWYATEVVSDENLGYGTYIFTIIGDLANIPENIVLGLFTWDNNTFYEQANSEVDIEFSKWGNAENNNPLTYSVQPVSFGTFYSERTHQAVVTPSDLIGASTHGFTWTDTLITWKSYAGYKFGEGELLAEWSFDLNNPARIKAEDGNTSLPIVIPAPGSTTNARINFWILTSIAAKPTDGLEHEVIIDSFQYIPL
jgi:hypothetical protein